MNECYRPYCTHIDGCDAPSERMVGPWSLCEAHAQAEEADRARDQIRRQAIMAEIERTPVTIVNVVTGQVVGTYRNEFEAEQALESRVS